MCSYGCNYQYPNISSDNGLAPIRRQAIIWTDADTVHWHIDAALGGDELNKLCSRLAERSATRQFLSYWWVRLLTVITHYDSEPVGMSPWEPMMTSSNGNIFHVTGPLCGEFTGHRRIPLTKASDAELWCFLWSAPEQTVVYTIEASVIWDAIALIMTSV